MSAEIKHDALYDFAVSRPGQRRLCRVQLVGYFPGSLLEGPAALVWCPEHGDGHCGVGDVKGQARELLDAIVADRDRAMKVLYG